MKIQVYGSSDDLVEIEGCEGGDEFNNSSDSVVKLSGSFIAPNNTGMRLIVMYDQGTEEASGCWMSAIGLLEEDADLPKWKIKTEAATNGYSTLLTLDAPEGTRFVSDEKWD